MTERIDDEGFRVLVEFRSSSSKDGKDGYRVVITDAATDDDVTDAVVLARTARLQCLTALEQDFPALKVQLDLKTEGETE